MNGYEYEQDKTYCKLVKFVLNSEGGYVDNPKDPGGPTKYGIAVNYNRAILDSMGIRDVRNLTYEQATQVYYRKYYLASGADVLARLSVRLAYLHFDSAVNHGVGTAAKFLRQLHGFALLKYYEGAGANKDFWFIAFLEYIVIRQKFYTGISTWQTFGRGWVNRMSHVIDHASRMEN